MKRSDGVVCFDGGDDGRQEVGVGGHIFQFRAPIVCRLFLGFEFGKRQHRVICVRELFRDRRLLEDRFWRDGFGGGIFNGQHEMSLDSSISVQTVVVDQPPAQCRGGGGL